jgi:DNA-binding transcriptional ArsR family regulator
MSFSKAHLFDPADQMTSSFARVLSHPVRLEIIRFLAKKGSSSVENLTGHYPLAKSTISQHLELMRDADIVQYKEEYPYIVYSLNQKTFKELMAYIQEYFQSI